MTDQWQMILDLRAEVQTLKHEASMAKEAANVFREVSAGYKTKLDYANDRIQTLELANASLGREISPDAYGLGLKELCQIMLDPENHPPQFSKEEAWEKFLKIQGSIEKPSDATLLVLLKEARQMIRHLVLTEADIQTSQDLVDRIDARVRAEKVSSHEKSFACVKPGGDGCDGKHTSDEHSGKLGSAMSDAQQEHRCPPHELPCQACAEKYAAWKQTSKESNK